eukprot:symbB.v1.2.027187.t1/scaffold2768.1/size73204/3
MSSKVQSSRQFCRQGFALALAELLHVMPNQLSTVLQLLEKSAELQSGLRANEQKDRLLARTFVYGAIIQDDRFALWVCIWLSPDIFLKNVSALDPKTFPLLIQDTSDSDNQLALFGFLQNILKDLPQVSTVNGLWGVSPRHVDLSFPGAFNKAIVGNRPDFRAFEPVKNFHEGTGMVARSDQEMGNADISRAALEDSKLVLRNEIRRTYAVIMEAGGLDPSHQSSWELMLRCFPCCVLPFPEEHLLSHHYFAREFLFDRADLEGHRFGDPLSAATYNRIVREIDGEVAVDANGAYDRKADVSQGFAEKRRQRARRFGREMTEGD